jgi:hypothetical protein
VIPRVGHVLNGYLTKQKIKLVTSVVINHIPTEQMKTIEIELNYQPMPAEKIQRKPEEFRSWKWYNVWMKSSIILKTNDIIFVNCMKFRIDSKTDWSPAGYYEYEAIQDFTGSNNGE